MVQQSISISWGLKSTYTWDRIQNPVEELLSQELMSHAGGMEHGAGRWLCFKGEFFDLGS